MSVTFPPDLLRQLKQEAASQGGRLTIETGAVRLTVRLAAARRETPCERDVLAVLADEALPASASRVLAELERRGALHGESTVRQALTRLAKRGAVRINRGPPRGYYLPGLFDPV